MKVLFLCGDPFTDQRFGVSEHVYQLSRALADLGNRIRIVSMSSHTESWKERKNVWGSTLERRWFHYFLPWMAIRQLERTVRSNDPDVIHLHGTTLPYVLAGLLLSRRYPLVVTIHGDVLEEAAFKPVLGKVWARILLAPLQKLALKRIRTIVVASQAMRQRVAGLSLGHISVVPNGIDIGDHSGMASSDLEDFSYVLFIGALRRVKGVDILIRAIFQAGKQDGPISLYIAGEGRERRNLEKLAADKGVENQVKFIGFVSGGDKIALIRQAGIVVVPSRYEASGIVLLESMALRRPVIASRTGGIPEIVRDGESGLLFNVGDISGLSEMILELKSSPKLRKRLGDAGRLVAENRSWTDIARRMVEVYEECLKRPAGI